MRGGGGGGGGEKKHFQPQVLLSTIFFARPEKLVSLDSTRLHISSTRPPPLDADLHNKESYRKP